MDRGSREPTGVSNPAIGLAWCVMFWNHAEMTAKQIGQLLLGETALSMAITAELGNVTLMNALKVASHDMRTGNLAYLAEHLNHFATGYERLLGYRNFYVHGLFSYDRDDIHSSETGLVLFSLDGKGRVRYFNKVVKLDDLILVLNNIQRLIGYGMAIQKELGGEGDGLERMLALHGASLEKPDWLPQVEKTPLYLQGQAPPPQSSPRTK